MKAYRYRVRIMTKEGETLFDSILATLSEAYDFLSAHLSFNNEWWMESIDA